MNWSSNENIEIIYRLLKVRGVGFVQANKLLSELKGRVHNSQQLECEIKASLKPEVIDSFDRQYQLFQRDGKVRYTSLLDDDTYPLSLLNFLKKNTPTVLSYMGNINLLRLNKIGFSGSRKVSEKGMWITKDCISQLASEEVCIVSGYANGVDMVSHRTALENGISTIIVLPEGISSFYVKKELDDVWDWNRVLVISEFMPEDKWMASRAMKRNMTIIGLSDVMVVIEAGMTGGSFDAGLKTIDSGKSLFVPLYRDAPETAKGNIFLINHGAKTLCMKASSSRTNIDGINSMIHKQSAMQTLF